MSPSLSVQTVQLGLLGESGEVADVIKKSLERNQSVNREKLVEELGDVLWYTAAKLHLHKTPLPAPQALSQGQVSLTKLSVRLCEEASFLGAAYFPFEFVPAAQHVLGIVEELGDALTPRATLSEIMVVNIQKLRQRHANGFSTTTPRPNVLKRMWRAI